MITNLKPRGNLTTLHGSQIVPFMSAGLPPTHFTPGYPPQSAAAPLLTHPVASSGGADCPTCNLVEIPYDPSLPVLKYNG